MKLKIYFLLALLICCLFGKSQNGSIIPKPNYLEINIKKQIKLTDYIYLYYSSDSLRNEILYFSNCINEQSNFAISGQKIKSPNGNSKPPVFEPKSFIFKLSNKLQKESYELTIDSNKIEILAGDQAGIFYGIQTFLQLLPIDKFDKTISLPYVKIKDSPRFEWRGMHLDVCRHFFPKEFIKKYIDYLAMYKMNVFHWHLTEDQGWRIAIHNYPKLTEIGGFRNGSMIGPYSDHRIDSVRYGGYYSQEEIKEIVEYANKKHITIVPEIEMPGHSLAALAAYPEFSCTGGPFEVAKEWGVFDDVYCAGNENTFRFLETVLDEVCELFPGKYIHIGGDECPKTRWKTCEKCQKRIKENGLKDEHELQSYFIQRIEKYLNSKGKQIIGWDEILEGGLAPNAAVMSWRGTEGGIAATKQKHKVVMTPGSHCYFDHYQGNPHFEPHAIGGYTTLEKVYSYEPIPKELNVEEAKYIMGAQGNVWTEYINSSSQVEYMAIPRMCALAEVLWTQPENKNEKDFLVRLSNQLKILDKKNVNYAMSFIQPTVTIKKATKGVDVAISKPNVAGTISYNIRPAKRVKYKDLKMIKSTDEIVNLHIEKSCFISSFFSMNDSVSGHMKWNNQNLEISKSTSKKITYSVPPSTSYNKNADFTLVNGVKASLPKINTEWLGWNETEFEIIIDLGKIEKIKKLKIGALEDKSNWIWLPSDFLISFSKDGISYNDFGLTYSGYSKFWKNNREYSAYIKKNKSRYIKIIVKSHGIIFTGLPGEGKNAWTFLDEIIIN